MNKKLRFWVFSAAVVSMLFMSAPPAMAGWYLGTSALGIGSTSNGGIQINLFGLHIVIGGSKGGTQTASTPQTPSSSVTYNQGPARGQVDSSNGTKPGGGQGGVGGPQPAPPEKAVEASAPNSSGGSTGANTASASSSSSNNSTVTPPPVTDQTITAGSYGNIGISGPTTTLTLQGGTYHMQNVSVTNGAQVVFNAPTVVYMSGTMNVSAASLHTSGNQASNLLILGTADCTAINITGPGDVYAAIYAPAAAVTLNNVNLHGAVVCDNLNATNSLITYDVTLRTLTYPGVGQVTARSVEEFGVK